MPSLSFSTCSSDSDCNGAGNCVSDVQNGFFHCDCTNGYIAPYCRNRDPCLLGGNTACQNGATCKRVSNFDYECKCRVPYLGEFCETYDLCDVDAEECVGDLNTKNPLDPVCHPCIPGATCEQISEREYTCICKAGFNHSSCFAYPVQPNPRPGSFLTDIWNGENWNPIIPTIALTSCFLYFLFLLIFLFCLRKRLKYQPKLIVCCDIRRFDDLAYYLISVETGSQWTAGTRTNVHCVLCGENGQAGPYPLNDLNLCEIKVLQRCQEDNYLVSHKVELGHVDKIVIWYDEKPGESSWYCDKITVRNIKTGENWHFFVSSWIHSTKKNRRHEFLAATSEYLQRRLSFGINCLNYWYQVPRIHTYISAIVHTTPTRITLMFAHWMSYMLVLIKFYGFLKNPDADIDYVANYVFTWIVPEYGSWAALICFWTGLFLSSLIMAFIHSKRIPTLLVWHNKPGMPEYEIGRDWSEQSSCSDCPEFVDVATQTSFDKLEYFVPHQTDIIPAQKSKSIVSQHLFRIPSTDLVKTEKWVYEAVKKSHGTDGLADDALVHDYTSNKQFNIPEVVLDYGLIGGLTDGRQQEPNQFVYKANSRGSNIAELRRAIEKDIRKIYGDMQLNNMPRSHDNFEQHEPVWVSSGSPPPISHLYLKEYQQHDSDNSIDMTSQKLAAGDFQRDDILQKFGTRVQVYCQFCEMEIDRCSEIMAKIYVTIGWIICLYIIIAATVICCIYGGRYGYQRTYDWIISLVICWLENFLVYQFLFVLLIVIIVALLIKRRKLRNIEEEKIRSRLQVYYVNGLTVLHDRRPLRYVLYLQKHWTPTPTHHAHLDVDIDSNSSASLVIY